MSDPLTTMEITLSRVIDEDGHMSVRITVPSTYSAVEILGLLEVAKLHVYRDMGGSQ